MPEKPKSDNPYVVGPVVRALEVLIHVAEIGHDVPLAAVVKALQIPKTTCFRYLQTLTEAGFLHHDASTDRYGVGSRFRAMARTDHSFNRLRTLARPAMLQLEREFNETVNLGVRAGAEIVYIEIVEAHRTLRIQGRVGDRHPLHSTALGKAILARMPEETVRVLLEGPLEARTSRTATDRTEIEREIRRMARQGYATEMEENEEAAACVAAAIVDASGDPIAAISLSAPKQRFPRPLIQEIGLSLRNLADQISRELATG